MEKQKDSFQEKIIKLEKIVDKISKNEIPLEEALKLYDEGSKIIKELEKKIEESKEKIEKIVNID